MKKILLTSISLLLAISLCSCGNSESSSNVEDHPNPSGGTIVLADGSKIEYVEYSEDVFKNERDKVISCANFARHERGSHYKLKIKQSLIDSGWVDADDPYIYYCEDCLESEDAIEHILFYVDAK